MGRFLGSLPAIMLQVSGMLVLVLLDLVVSHTRFHIPLVTTLLGLLILTFFSLSVYYRRRKEERRQVVIDDAADDLANRITEILETALIEAWPTRDEGSLYREERESKEVWVLAANLRADLGSRRGTILDNLADGKTYHYICHHDDRAERQLHLLWHTCEGNVKGFKGEQLEMRCLPARKLPPLQLLVLQPAHSVHVFFPGAPEGHRVLTIPARSQLSRDIETAYHTLWGKLPALSHGEGEELSHQ